MAEEKKFVPEIINGTDNKGQPFGMTPCKAYANKFGEGYNCVVELPVDGKPNEKLKLIFPVTGVPPQYVKIYRLRMDNNNGIPTKS